MAFDLEKEQLKMEIAALKLKIAREKDPFLRSGLEMEMDALKFRMEMKESQANPLRPPKI